AGAARTGPGFPPLPFSTSTLGLRTRSSSRMVRHDRIYSLTTASALACWFCLGPPPFVGTIFPGYATDAHSSRLGRYVFCKKPRSRESASWRRDPGRICQRRRVLPMTLQPIFDAVVAGRCPLEFPLAWRWRLLSTDVGPLHVQFEGMEP